MKLFFALSAVALMSACSMADGSPMAAKECQGHLGLTPGSAEYKDCIARLDSNTVVNKKGD